MKQDHKNIKNTNFDQEHIFTDTLKPLRNLFQTFHVKRFVAKYYFSIQSVLAEKSSIFPIIQENLFLFLIKSQKSQSCFLPLKQTGCKLEKKKLHYSN